MSEEESSKLTLRESITLLAERQKHNDWLLFVSPEGLRYLNLRYDEHRDTQNPFQLMFKRSPELKKYYPQIRNWFAENNLAWKDMTVDREKYMTTKLPSDTQLLEKLVLSAQNDIFNVAKTYISSRDSSLSIKLSGIKAPFLGLFCAFAIMICLVAYVLYQVSNLRNLGSLSLAAFTREEAFLVIVIPLGFLGLRFSGYIPTHTKKEKSNWKKPKVVFSRLLLLALVLLGFCTY